MATTRSMGAGFSAIVAALWTLMTIAPAQAGDGVQFSSDCSDTYVNKRVGGNEQWAITRDVSAGDVTGNVFKLDGSPPSFIECTETDRTDTNVVLDCYGSVACASPPCGGTQWSLIVSGTSIPISFFLPPGVSVSDPASSCVAR